MEKALLISDIRQLDKINHNLRFADNRKPSTKNRFDRIYYGAEFCENKIPDLNTLKRVYSSAKKFKKRFTPSENSLTGFTLLTPYVTTFGLKRLEPLFGYLDSQNSNIEVVVNDWGVLKLIRDNYKNLQPVLGRLLTKQRRDPRAKDILLNRQKAKRVIDEKSKKTFILIPKKVPTSLYEHFKGSVINTPIFQRFLLDNGIRRVEIDNLVWDMKIELPKEIGVSIYLPYAYVTTTRLCGLINLTYSACQKECQRYYFSFKSDSSPVPFYIRGNTVFYKSEMPSIEYLRQKHIDRIVYELEVPV
jgi:hypothetical protein